MEYDNEDEITSNLVMELEEAFQMLDGVPNPDTPFNADEATNDTLLTLP